MLRSAIELKEALERAPLKLRSIGRIVNDELTWMAEHSVEDSAEGEDADDDDWENEQGVGDEDDYDITDDDGDRPARTSAAEAPAPMGRAVRAVLASAFCDLGKKLDKLALRYASGLAVIKSKAPLARFHEDGYSPRFGDVDEDTVVAWSKQRAVAATFGDLRVMETKVDASVRLASDIPADRFGVPDPVCREVERLWAGDFWPRAVRAVPHKINLYGPGGHFVEHRDTPAKDLVGTFLLSLFDSTDNRAGLELKDEKGAVLFTWSPHRQRSRAKDRVPWCAFYTDVPHRVKRIRTGYRVTLSFKIYSGCCAPEPSAGGKAVTPPATSLETVKVAGNGGAARSKKRKRPEPKAGERASERLREKKQRASAAAGAATALSAATLLANEDVESDQGEMGDDLSLSGSEENSEASVSSDGDDPDDGASSLSAAAQRHVRSAVRKVLAEGVRVFGLVLSHRYSLHSDETKGADALCVSGLLALGLQVTVLPAVTTFHAEWMPDDGGEEAIARSRVYPMTDAHADFLLGSRAEPPEPVTLSGVVSAVSAGTPLPAVLADLVAAYCPPRDPRVPVDFFLCAADARYAWRQNDQRYIEHTGNECQPEEQDSLYLHRVAIVEL